jgi:hypothetical protein
MPPGLLSEVDDGTESFKTFDRTPWAGDQSILRAIPALNNTAHKDVGIHPYAEQDSSPQSQCSSSPRPYAPYIMRSLWSVLLKLNTENHEVLSN